MDLDQYGTAMNFSGELILKCSHPQKTFKIEVLNQSTWQIAGIIENVESVSCGGKNMQRLKDSKNYDLVSFISNNRDIWVSNLYGEVLMPQKSIDYVNLDFPQNLNILNFSWHP